LALGLGSLALAALGSSAATALALASDLNYLLTIVFYSYS